MPRFRVNINGPRLDRAMAMLNGSGIPTVGGFPADFIEQGPPADWDLDGLAAVVDAESPADAAARVQNALPADSNHTVQAVGIAESTRF